MSPPGSESQCRPADTQTQTARLDAVITGQLIDRAVNTETMILCLFLLNVQKHKDKMSERNIIIYNVNIIITVYNVIICMFCVQHEGATAFKLFLNCVK